MKQNSVELLISNWGKEGKNVSNHNSLLVTNIPILCKKNTEPSALIMHQIICQKVTLEIVRKYSVHHKSNANWLKG